MEIGDKGTRGCRVWLIWHSPYALGLGAANVSTDIITNVFLQILLRNHIYSTRLLATTPLFHRVERDKRSLKPNMVKNTVFK